MTVIAWDGKTLAADKRSVNHGLQRTVTKLHRIYSDAVVAFSGHMATGLEMVEWIRGGRDPGQFPSAQRNSETTATVVLFDSFGLWVFERGPIPILVEEPFFATGSGRDYAIAAMHCGRSAREAVAIASIYDVDCGNGIDSMGIESSALDQYLQSPLTADERRHIDAVKL